MFPKSSFHGESGRRNDDTLDDIHFDDLWDMIESDAALGRGLEALIDPRVGKVVEQARRQEQQQQRRSSNSSALKHQEGGQNVTSCASKQHDKSHGESPMFTNANHQPPSSYDQHSNNMDQPYQQSQMPSLHATAPATNHKQQHYSYPKEQYQHGYFDNNGTEPARPPHPQQRPIVDTYGEEIEQFQV
jgi:hypothetical protein